MADGHFPVPEQDEGRNACGCRTLVSSGSSVSLGKGIGTSPEEQGLWEADTSPRYCRGLRVRLKHGF